MLTTDFVPGAPDWLDLGSADVEASSAFYGGLFGWTFRSAGPDAGGYGFFQLDGRTVAAAGPPMGEGGAPRWTLYFHTADADATAEAVEQAGGSVRFAPLDVFTAGRTAGFTDPTGAEFAVWQPGGTRGLDAVTDPGTLCWTELHTSDAAAARAFYGTVLGWDAQDMPLGDFTYTVVSTSGGGQDASFGGVMPLLPEQQAAGVGSHWLPYFEVADCDAVVARAQRLGGRVVMPPATMAGVGRMAQLKDPSGASFSVIASAAG
ncbi:VOC family protein [Peterkaempfera griseoplana]|uniref:VOC family protein n=1 Tax=Peterkaempfera griseoplana TaxID=66896 RepID=UPI0006E2881A|nr:VOC family protein [Peterkaempfera griseoplana]